MPCSRIVFRCFKCLERLGDRLTGAAGPYFVGLAVVLISTGTICFFDVIAPRLPFPWFTIPICAVIALNLLGHYYYACSVAPGFVDDLTRIDGTGFLWAKRTRRRALTGVSWSDEMLITRALATKCRKCGQSKPERAHHCRICNRCILKYDHHCPWVNQCVGLHNERHFVLFMAYLVLSTFCLGISGYPYMLDALGLSYPIVWPHNVPALAFGLTYILSVVLCFAVGIMLSYHLWTISMGETSVEGLDHGVYRKLAKSRGEVFVNSYDLGVVKNLKLFFNVGENGYPFYTLLLPYRISPYTDGRAWARRKGYVSHEGVRAGEELTDEDDG